MGTRNLQMVINKEGDTKIAQYCQWDGYPSGQGVDILAFLLKIQQDQELKKQFLTNLDKLRFATQTDSLEVEHFLKGIGVNDVWMNMEQSKLYQERYYYLSRDCGSDIFNLVLEGSVPFLSDASSADSQNWNEWAYIVNFKTNVLEVYQDTTFNKPLKVFDLDNLPTPEEFVEQLSRA